MQLQLRLLQGRRMLRMCSLSPPAQRDTGLLLFKKGGGVL